MNTLFTPPHLIHNILLSILLIGLSALTLLSCSEDSLTGSQEMQPQSTSGNVMTTAELDDSLLFNSQTHSEKDPQQNHKNFMEMLSTVENMQREEIEDVTDEQLLELGKPVLEITENTVQLSPKLLLSIENQLSALNLNMRELNEAQLESIKRRFQMALRENPNDRPEIRKLKAKDIRRLLLDYYDSIHADNMIEKVSTASLGTFCEDMYNVSGDTVILYPGDNLNTASRVCYGQQVFFLTPGSYYNQHIDSSTTRVAWVGYGASTKLDGTNTTNQAFSGWLKDNSISYLTIQNYTENGIYSTSSYSTGIDIHHVTFKKIAPNKDGESNGAVNLYNCKDIQVRDSYFEDVASAILYTHCDGPLKANNNEALNAGRNFFQCNDCEGAGIRVNGNSLEHTTGYGNAVLEDWINIFNSKGTQSDWIEVNYNRARGHSDSNSGSFIILADSTGTYQEAIGNIGVSPGQVGIGVASGEHILVEGNKMFSDNWMHSNVAYYSIDFHSPCDNHDFPASPNPNIANWRDSSGVLNRATSNGKCGISNTDIRTNVEEDTTMGPEIWNLW